MSSITLTYVLITPARNEEEYLRQTIDSVVSQTLLPKRWIIVSDGSTDGTDEIVSEHVKKYSWMQLIRMPQHRDRSFSAKVFCFNTAYQTLQNRQYDVIGNLDADISFPRDYIEYLLAQFAQLPKLGVAGTPFVENGSTYDYRFTNIHHVSGACQLFRRECFEEIGGYLPVKSGGIDWIAVTTARMMGWNTRTFLDRTCFHNKKLGSGNIDPLLAPFNYGKKDYYLGGHPAWQFLRAFYQMTKRPYVLSGALLFFGYIWAFFNRYERPIPRSLMTFHRREQLQRMRLLFRQLF